MFLIAVGKISNPKGAKNFSIVLVDQNKKTRLLKKRIILKYPELSVLNKFKEISKRLGKSFKRSRRKLENSDRFSLAILNILSIF